MKSLAINALFVLASLGQAKPVHPRSSPIEASLELGALDLSNFSSQGNPSEAYDPERRPFKLTWLETFGGEAGALPSSKNWIFSQGTQYPGGAERWGNNEFQYYTDSTKNSVLTGQGTMKIIPREAPRSIRNATILYTSARLETQRTDFAATEGGKMYVGSRIKLHGVDKTNMQGVWAAFWALGESFRGNYTNWPMASEWDLLEVLNGDPKIYNTLHCGFAPGGPCEEYNGIGNGGVPWQFDTWNDVGFLVDRAIRTNQTWKDERLEWYLNGDPVHNVTGGDIGDFETWEKIAHEGHFLLLNVAMGGNWPGPPNNKTVSGEKVAMEVDYVGVWNSAH